jgi:hypothetical protein
MILVDFLLYVSLVSLLPQTFELFGFIFFPILSIPDDGYSRNSPCPLNLISTFSFSLKRKNSCADPSKSKQVYFIISYTIRTTYTSRQIIDSLKDDQMVFIVYKLYDKNNLHI